MIRFITLMFSCAATLFTLNSCDKVGDLTSKAKSLVGVNSSSDIVVVNEVEGKELIEKESRLLVIEYYLEGSEPCQAFDPALTRLAVANANKAKVVKVNVNEENDRAWAKRQGLKGVPVFQFYNDGKLVHQITGVISETDFQSKMEFYALSEKAREEKGEPVQSIKSMPKNWLPPGISRS